MSANSQQSDLYSCVICTLQKRRDGSNQDSFNPDHDTCSTCIYEEKGNPDCSSECCIFHDIGKKQANKETREKANTSGTEDIIATQCPVHLTQNIDFVCMDDRCMLCAYCGLSKDHRGHEVIPLKELHTRAALKAAHYKNELENFNVYSSSIYKLLQEEKKSLEDVIEGTFEKMKRSLERQKNKMLSEVNNLFAQEQNKKIKTESLTRHSDIPDRINNRIKTLSSGIFNKVFFKTLRSTKDLNAPLEKEYQRIGIDCQNLRGYLIERLNDHKESLFELVKEMKTVDFSFRAPNMSFISIGEDESFAFDDMISYKGLNNSFVLNDLTNTSFMRTQGRASTFTSKPIEIVDVEAESKDSECLGSPYKMAQENTVLDSTFFTNKNRSFIV